MRYYPEIGDMSLAFFRIQVITKQNLKWQFIAK